MQVFASLLTGALQNVPLFYLHEGILTMRRRVFSIISMAASACVLTSGYTASSASDGGSVEVPVAIPSNNIGNWVTTNDYPQAAIAKGHEGTTRFELTISPSGVVTDCVITASSGSADLDRLTCELIYERAMFEPPRDAKNRPAAGTFKSAVRWILPNVDKSTPPKPKNSQDRWITDDAYPAAARRNGLEGVVRYRLIVAPSGRVSSCIITASSGHSSLDEATCKRLTRYARFETATDDLGRPIQGDFYGSHSWRLPPAD